MQLSRSRHAVPAAVLLDPSGALGRLYHAKTTPHLFVIDAQGDLQYMGGIDSIATADVADIPHAEPYFKEALLAVVDDKPVAHPVTRPTAAASSTEPCPPQRAATATRDAREFSAPGRGPGVVHRLARPSSPPRSPACPAPRTRRPLPCRARRKPTTRLARMACETRNAAPPTAIK